MYFKLYSILSKLLQHYGDDQRQPPNPVHIKRWLFVRQRHAARPLYLLKVSFYERIQAISVVAEPFSKSIHSNCYFYQLILCAPPKIAIHNCSVKSIALLTLIIFFNRYTNTQISYLYIEGVLNTNHYVFRDMHWTNYY